MRGIPGFPLLIGTFCLLILVIIGVRYNDYEMRRNFFLDVNTSCDAGSQNCFVSDCSPDSDPGCPPGPYEKIHISAKDAPGCLEEHACTDFSCGSIESCSVTYCSDDALEDGESCSVDSNATSSSASSTTTQ